MKHWCWNCQTQNPTQGLTEPAPPTGPDIPFVPPSTAPVLPIDDWMTWEWLNFNKSFIINLFGDWTQNLTDLWTYKMTKILQFSRQIFRNMSKRKENRLLCAGLTIGQSGQWPSLSTDCSSSSSSATVRVKLEPDCGKMSPRPADLSLKSDLETRRCLNRQEVGDIKNISRSQTPDSASTQCLITRLNHREKL